MPRRTKEELETKNIRLEKDHAGRDVWVLRKQWPDGETLRRRMPYERAEKLLRDIDSAIDRGTWRELKKQLSRDINSGSSPDFDPAMTISELCDLHFEKYVKAHNDSLSFKSQHLNKIKEIVGTKKVIAFTMTDAEEVKLARLDEEVCHDTINKTMAVMNKMFNWAVKTKHFLQKNPMERYTRLDVDKIKRPRLKPQEYRRLVSEACRIHPLGGAFIGVCGELAVRPWAEGSELKRTLISVDSEGGTWIWVEPSKHDHVGRHIPLSPFALELIDTLPVVFDSDHLFVRLNDPRGTMITRPYIDGIFAKSAEIAGCAWATMYDLRRYRATTWAAGAPLPNVQKWMGHKDIRTTMVYVEAVDDQRHMLESYSREMKRVSDAGRKEGGNGDISATA